MKSVLHVAHSLKGTLAMFGAYPAREVAAQLERQSKLGTTTGMAALLAQLVSEVDQLLVALTRVVHAEGTSKSL